MPGKVSNISISCIPNFFKISCVCLIKKRSLFRAFLASISMPKRFFVISVGSLPRLIPKQSEREWAGSIEATSAFFPFSA